MQRGFGMGKQLSILTAWLSFGEVQHHGLLVLVRLIGAK